MVERKSRRGGTQEWSVKEEEEASFLSSVKMYFWNISIQFTWAEKLGMVDLLSGGSAAIFSRVVKPW